MVRTVRPKARATPAKAMPRCGKPAASTALPQPPKTSQKVPKNSAARFLVLIHPRLKQQDLFYREMTLISRDSPRVCLSDANRHRQEIHEALAGAAGGGALSAG